MPGQTPCHVPSTAAAEPSARRLRAVISTTGLDPASALTAAAVPSANEPSSTIPLTPRASAARATATVSPPGAIRASVTRPRFSAAATSSGA
jgi:hypothetical protein